MRNRSLFVTALVTALVAGMLPVGDACALPEAANHECCAGSEPVQTQSCCAGAPEEPEHSSSGICDCVHPSPTPVTATTPTVRTDAEAGAPTPAPADTTTLALNEPSRTLAPQSRVRSHPPPPVFILDCAYLI